MTRGTLRKRWAARIDQHHAEIVARLRAVGCVVVPLHTVGQGVPDLLVGYRGRTYLLEVKTTGEGLNDLQAAWHAAWRGGPLCIVTGPDDALGAVIG